MKTLGTTASHVGLFEVFKQNKTKFGKNLFHFGSLISFMVDQRQLKTINAVGAS